MSKSERELIVELEAVLNGRRYSPVVIRNTAATPASFWIISCTEGFWSVM